MYAEKKGWELTAIEVAVRFDVDVDGQRGIERTITVPVDLSVEQRQRLAAIAERTPVTLAISGGTPINTTLQTHYT
jgi:putative redox protein